MHATKKKIIAKAEFLIRQHGYDGTSLNDVVAKAGVSKGAFFHHYRSKQEVTIDILDKYATEQLFAPFDKHMEKAPNVKAGLLAWLQEMFGAFASGKFKGGCLLGNFALELSDKDEVIREHMKQIFLQWENQMTAHFKKPAAEGKLWMEPRQFARLLIAAVEGATLTTKVHKDHNRASREFLAVGEMIRQMVQD